MSFSEIDVAIIGAGPYGLSLATHLDARGVDHRIFGRSMQAWADMSPGMYLKSFVFATNIYAPQAGFDFEKYCVERGLESFEPAEIAEFARYGIWVQKQLVPYLEETNVVAVTQKQGYFHLTLATGEEVRARRVVNAVGLTYFERLPQELSALPTHLASHTSQHGDFEPFRGKRVMVIGAGQSALQAAALLHEHEAQVELFVRGAGVYFSGRMNRQRPIQERFRNPNSVLGPSRHNWVLEHLPMAMRFVDEEKRVNFTRRHLGPSGAWWLSDRVMDRFPIHAQHMLREAVPSGTGVRLRFATDDGTDRVVNADHVIAGTGYEVDVDHISYLDRDLAGSVSRLVRAPRLTRHFEALSVPGLYFVGPSSAFSFGPLYRFVAGADYTSRVIVRHLARKATRARSARRVTDGTRAAVTVPAQQ